MNFGLNQLQDESQEMQVGEISEGEQSREEEAKG